MRWTLATVRRIYYTRAIACWTRPRAVAKEVRRSLEALELMMPRPARSLSGPAATPLCDRRSGGRFSTAGRLTPRARQVPQRRVPEGRRRNPIPAIAAKQAWKRLSAGRHAEAFEVNALRAGSSRHSVPEAPHLSAPSPEYNQRTRIQTVTQAAADSIVRPGGLHLSESHRASNTTTLFARWSSGDAGALNNLLEHLYRDIHAIAVRELRSEGRLTIRPTALVHEVYLRMASLREPNWQDRVHFLSMAARVARQALVDEARRRRSQKRDGGTPVTLSDENLAAIEGGFDALDVDSLLLELKDFDEVAAEVVSLRVFGGLSIEETAAALGLSTATVNRRWVTGKAWLAHELADRS